MVGLCDGSRFLQTKIGEWYTRLQALSTRPSPQAPALCFSTPSFPQVFRKIFKRNCLWRGFTGGTITPAIQPPVVIKEPAYRVPVAGARGAGRRPEVAGNRPIFSERTFSVVLFSSSGDLLRSLQAPAQGLEPSGEPARAARPCLGGM